MEMTELAAAKALEAAKEVKDVSSGTDGVSLPRFENKELSMDNLKNDTGEAQLSPLKRDIPHFSEKNLDAFGGDEIGKQTDAGMKNPDSLDAKELPNESPKKEGEDLGEQKDVNETKPTGGTYGELKKEWSGELEKEPPHEIHHMPANDVNGLDVNDGPAIVMDKADHRQTASCGNSLEAKEYREKQRELVENGKFEEAMQMDIDDIHEKFGDKYDDSIEQMKESAKEKGYIQ